MSAEPIVIVDSDEEAAQPSTSAALASSDQKDVATVVPQAAAPVDDEKEQMECPICLQTCIHPARLPCGHIFCFLCVKGVAYKNRRCAMCRREIPVEFLDHPNLLYKIEETAPTTEDGYQWFYEGRNGWWQYDERTSQEIEDAYKRPDKFCTILVAGYVYVVDFETMLQQRQNEPSRKRQVKRDLATIAKKGVAGLRIDGTADPQESSASSSMAAAYGSSSSGSASQTSHHHTHHHHHHHSGASSSSSRSPLPALVANNLISTIAATDAAIRIASDIIDSTLAHASTDSTSYDYHDHRSGGGGGASSRLAAGNRQDGGGSGAQSPTSHSSRQDLLNEVQEALNISSSGSPGAINGAGSAGAASSSTSPRLDFFSSTIDEFRSLALSNIAESTDSDTDDDDEDDDVAVAGISGATLSGVDEANRSTNTADDRSRSPTVATELF